MEGEHLDRDMISMLPGSIIEIILTLMPIRDAVRTSVLSKEWRYNWANIPKLVFDDKFLEGSSNREILYAIYEVLLLHRGPMFEFTLNMSKVEKRFEIDQILLHLSRHNTLKKLTLNGFDSLPSSIYSFQWLTHLNLVNSGLQFPSSFNGFSMLRTLYMDCDGFSYKMLARLVSGCPRLKSCTLLNFGMPSDGDDSSIVQLFECLPMVEHLHLDICYLPIKWFAPGEVPRQLSTSLVHLKYLHLSNYVLVEEREYSFALLLLRSSPYLEKIKIKICDEWDAEDLEGIIEIRVELDSSVLERINLFLELQDYTDVSLDHLKEFEIESFNNIAPELEFLKLILMKSPLLRKVRVKLHKTVKYDEEMMLKSFLRLPRASPAVEIRVVSINHRTIESNQAEPNRAIWSGFLPPWFGYGLSF